MTTGRTLSPIPNGRPGFKRDSQDFWCKYDPSFDISEPEAYLKDVPAAEVHILDGGHFALDTAADQITALVRDFMLTVK